MSWCLHCGVQPYLGDVPVTTDGRACCWEAFVTEQSCSVLKEGHGSKHSVQMLFVLGSCDTACLPTEWERLCVLSLSPNTDQCVTLGCLCRLLSQMGSIWDSAVYYRHRYCWWIFTMHCADFNLDLCNKFIMGNKVYVICSWEVRAQGSDAF